MPTGLGVGLPVARPGLRAGVGAQAARRRLVVASDLGRALVLDLARLHLFVQALALGVLEGVPLGRRGKLGLAPLVVVLLLIIHFLKVYYLADQL